MSSAFTNLLLGIILLLLVQYFGSTAEDWSYTGPKGVYKWCTRVSSKCCGSNQSPVDLSSLNAYYGRVEPFHLVDYFSSPSFMAIRNNGHTVEVTIKDDDLRPRISGGGLDGEYIFDEFHFHWGKGSGESYKSGSEHTIDSYRYPLELQMVHYNSKFASITEALESGEKDAIAVLGILYDYTINGPSGSALSTIASHLRDIRHAEDSKEFRQTFPLTHLLPNSIKKGFYRYLGSLTTPKCDEVVIWTIFADTKSATVQELSAFTSIYSSFREEDSKPLVNNYRPIQPINNRIVMRLLSVPDTH